MTDLASRLFSLLARYNSHATARLLGAMATIGWPGGPYTERVEEVLLHLFQHQIHHRGQAHAMLSGTGTAPPQLDEFFPQHDRHATAKAHHA